MLRRFRGTLSTDCQGDPVTLAEAPDRTFQYPSIVGCRIVPLQSVVAEEHQMTITPEMRIEVLSSLRIAMSDLEAIEEECPGYDLQPVIQQLLAIIRKLESAH